MDSELWICFILELTNKTSLPLGLWTAAYFDTSLFLFKLLPFSLFVHLLQPGCFTLLVCARSFPACLCSAALQRWWVAVTCSHLLSNFFCAFIHFFFKLHIILWLYTLYIYCVNCHLLNWVTNGDLTFDPVPQAEGECPAECSCAPSPPLCPPGDSWVTDHCGCCKVCARQFNEDCSATEPCDHIKGLRCHLGAGGDPKRGLCRGECNDKARQKHIITQNESASFSYVHKILWVLIPKKH